MRRLAVPLSLHALLSGPAARYGEGRIDIVLSGVAGSTATLPAAGVLVEAGCLYTTLQRGQPATHFLPLADDLCFDAHWQKGRSRQGLSRGVATGVGARC